MGNDRKDIGKSRAGRKILKRVKRSIFRNNDSCNTIHWKIERIKIKIERKRSVRI